MYFEIFIPLTLFLIVLYVALSIRRAWFLRKPYFTKTWFKRECILHGIYLLYAIGIVVWTERIQEAHWDLIWVFLVGAPYFSLFLFRYVIFILVRVPRTLVDQMSKKEESQQTLGQVSSEPAPEGAAPNEPSR
jgi:hypothetical protein